MNNLTEQSKIKSDLQSLEADFSLTKKELDDFKKLPKEQQEKLKITKLVELQEMSEKLDTAFQEAVKTGKLEEAQKLREQLEKEILDLNEQVEVTTINKISVDYSYINPNTKKVEFNGKIEINIEQKLQEFITFYEKTNINLPPGFGETIKDIWLRNQTEIQKAVEQNGFDDLLIIPGGIPLIEIKDKMSMEKGYWESDNFKKGGSFAGAVSKNVDNPRIILIHKAQELDDRPELKATLNTKGEDVKFNQTLTLEDYIIFHRKYFADTGTHLDVKKHIWLATNSGTRLVGSDWSSGGGELRVYANARDGQASRLGVRPSRSFF